MNGYSEKKVERDVYIVTFKANEMTPPEKVREYALQRAAELCQKKGYKSFVVIEELKVPYPSVSLKIKCFYS